MAPVSPDTADVVRDLAETLSAIAATARKAGNAAAQSGHPAQAAALEEIAESAASAIGPGSSLVTWDRENARLLGDWLTVREAADELRLHEKTVRRMIGRGEIVARKVGKSWRIHRDELPTAPRQRQPGPGRRPRRVSPDSASAAARQVIAGREAHT